MLFADSLNARTAIAFLALIEIFVPYLCFRYAYLLPQYTFIRIAAACLPMLTMVGILYAQMYVYRWFTGKNWAADLFVVFTMVIESGIVIGMIFYLIRSRP